MSSPYCAPISAYPGTPASSPRMSPVIAPDGSSVRPMLVKVLYTFDDQNKTNCLARCVRPHNIQAVRLDDTIEIGVLELMTCLETIINASPELVSKQLGHDYTVYAYDYSEYDTPLVGQGLLSRLLPSASTTASAPAHVPRTKITGRVCKNILGLFSNGVKETLEVKLRLVPVPKRLQGEQVVGPHTYQRMSNSMPEDCDAGAWTAFLQSNSGLLRKINELETQGHFISGADRRDSAGIGVLHQLLHQGASQPDTLGGSTTWNQQRLPQSNDYVSADMSAHPSRTASPTNSLHSVAPSKVVFSPTSRSSSRMDDQRSRTTQQPLPAPQGYEHSDVGVVESGAAHEEEPAKKRARITRTDWQGKSSLGSKPESLRVAASTAASIRVYRPIAMQPSNTGSSSFQQLPRAPTPRPTAANEIRHHPIPARRSNLQNESSSGEPLAYRSPYPPLNAGQESPEVNATSPYDLQDFSEGNTPSNIPSSPPAVGRTSPAPSSPVLPTLPLHPDSGFMSGRNEGLFEDDDDGRRTLDTERQRGIDTQAAVTIESTKPPIQSQSQPSGKAPNQAKPSHPTRAIKSCPKVKAAGPPRPALKRATTKLGSCSAPVSISQTIANDSSFTPYTTLHRSQTWSGTQAEPPTSDAPLPMEQTHGVSITKTRSGSGAKRKKAIQERLVASIATGEMPPYCGNCGAIETPTWRKAWSKIENGSPDNVDVADEEGGFLALEVLQRDEGGNATSYMVIKKFLRDDDEEFKEITMCNPCGLWLNKMKCMRPPERWSKEQKDPSKKKKATKRKGIIQDAPGVSVIEISNQASAPPIDQIVKADTAAHTPFDQDDKAQRCPARQRAASVEPNVSSSDSARRWSNSDASAVVHRAIQSSPVSFRGTQQSPIEVDELTPKPTRRLLFPTPTKEGEIKTLRSDLSSDNTSLKSCAVDGHLTHLRQPGDQDDKENCPPAAQELAESTYLPGDGYDQLPSTPLHTGSQAQGVPKTPIRSCNSAASYNAIFSSGGQLALPFTPRHGTTNEQDGAQMTPFTIQLNRFLSEANANVSPSAGNIDFTFLPSLNGDTPSRNATSFDFPHWDANNMFSTDVPMPSSPPTFFSLYEDPAEPVSGLWSDYDAPNSPARQTQDIVGLGAGAVPPHDNRQSKQNGDVTGVVNSEVDGKTKSNLNIDFSALIDEVSHNEVTAEKPREATIASSEAHIEGHSS